MIISSEQVRLALDYLQTTSEICGDEHPCDVPPELLERVKRVLDGIPECRDERIVDARDRFAVQPPSSEEIAEKMIGRIITDSLR